MNTSELISIIIPVYNRELYIEETLESIGNQSYSNWECILVDDHSTDTTISKINKFIALDHRFRLFKRPESYLKGACSCRNIGFEKSKGIFINFFDSDDIMHTNFLKNKIRFLQSDVSFDGVVSKTAFFQENYKDIFKYEDRTNLTSNLLEDFLALKITWYLCDIMWRKEFLINKILFDEELLMGQDRNFHVKMLADNPKLVLLDEYLVFYRKHSGSISAKYFSIENVVMTISHLNSSIEQLEYLRNRKLLTPRIKIILFNSGILYLPFTYNKKINIKLIKYLKSLFVFNILTIKNTIKFFIALLVYNITGRGYFILKI
jgi:glycosyltransferase involved in cell wall biosynthesis